MHALNLHDLEKRWRLWRNLDHLQRELGLTVFGNAADAGSDDARLEALPDDLIVPPTPRMD